MAARALEDIIRELDASYSPQRQSIQERLNALPAQADAEIKGLEGQQTQAFDSILAGARGRGLGFSGIPIAEQAQYTSSQFLPAVARVRQSQNENRLSLSDALNNIGLEQNRFAQSLRQSELDRDWEREKYERTLAEERARAASANTVRPTIDDPDAPKQEVRYVGNDDFRGRLAWEATKGNSDAKVALKYAGNDGRFDGAVANQSDLQALKRLGIIGNYFVRQASGGGGW